MNKIYKYSIPTKEKYTIELPKDARIIRVEDVEGLFFLWANSNPTKFKIPVSCSLKGQRLQRHQEFHWRYCHFPLIKNAITENDILAYWKSNGYLGGDLFEEKRQIEFPIVSNCIGCFHKKPETLSVMANMHPKKMAWFAMQEEKGMGTWLDSKITYQTLIDNSENWIPEMINESNRMCDTGTCTD